MAIMIFLPSAWLLLSVAYKKMYQALQSVSSPSPFFNRRALTQFTLSQPIIFYILICSHLETCLKTSSIAILAKQDSVQISLSINSFIYIWRSCNICLDVIIVAAILAKSMTKLFCVWSNFMFYCHFFTISHFHLNSGFNATDAAL